MTITINVFIETVLLHMLLYHASHLCPLRHLWHQLAGTTTLYIGLHHAWDMFAPDPIHVNRRLVANLVLANGQIRRWESPQFGGSSWISGFLAARDRKFFEELCVRDYMALRVAFAQALARYESKPGAEIVKVVLAVELVLVNAPARRNDPPPAMKRKEILAYDVVRGSAS